MFVNWKKGSDCWVKIGPYVMYCLLILASIIIPLVNVTLEVIMMIMEDMYFKSFYTCFKLFYLVLNLNIFVDYFWHVRKTYLKDA